MANMLQSAQTKSTCAPGWFTNYLSNLATAGQQAQQNAQSVGAQPLQEQAFCQIGQTAGATQPMFQQGANLVGQAASQNITGAAAPYLQAAAMSGGLCQANPYLQTAAVMNPAEMAQAYMNPYINSAVQSMSDVAHRNIQQNLAPQATAAAVGSGQYGSQRGAQVLGQVRAQAEQDLNNQIAQMMASGYCKALSTAMAKQQLLGQIGSTAGTLGQQQAQLLGQLGGTAGCVATKQAGVLQQGGLGLGTLAGQQAAQNLACVNALATLGGQQQTIAQNKELFPLSTLSNLASLLQGYQIPVSTKTTMCQSPLSALTGVGTLLGGVLQKGPGGTCSLLCTILNKFKSGFCSVKFASSGEAQCATNELIKRLSCNVYSSTGGKLTCAELTALIGGKSGGLVATGGIGCSSTKSRGALSE